MAPGTETNYIDLVGTKDQVLDALRRATGCDVYDVLASVACGSIGGVVDVFLVGAPGDGLLLEGWSDGVVDGAVQRFAKLSGWKPREGTDDVAHAIDFLERSFKVNYDQKDSSDVGRLFNMSTRDHHMKSLAHSPDPVGLFFSILNQFTSTASFVSGGGLITMKTDTFELQGGNVPARIFSGFANWLGHIMSDVAGSSTTRRRAGDGTGVAVPFFELLQFFDLGEFSADDGKGRVTLAELSIKVFQEGYDARFALAMGVPVVVTDLLTRLVWVLRRKFQYGCELKDCIPSKRHDSLRTMLLLSNTSLCAIDGADAFVESGGGKNAVKLCERLNFLAWLRLAALVASELRIRASYERGEIEVMRQINAALDEYLERLRELDIAAFEEETGRGERLAQVLSGAEDEGVLNGLLLGIYEIEGIPLSWDGSFDEHMSDRDATFRFA